jgi:hypothetical protein
LAALKPSTMAAHVPLACHDVDTLEDIQRSTALPLVPQCAVVGHACRSHILWRYVNLGKTLTHTPCICAEESLRPRGFDTAATLAQLALAVNNRAVVYRFRRVGGRRLAVVGGREGGALDIAAPVLRAALSERSISKAGRSDRPADYESPLSAYHREGRWRHWRFDRSVFRAVFADEKSLACSPPLRSVS